ncbi:thiamine diphosphokinase [Frigidibacter albus]|uniref:Thiamine diphosphokinase n=1 Tax=Frigidibacter albus TaxID=1465486 RepID=A0A6L8VDM8_9RHOB|nr:thiamine diphosphokinase [Frigidibacter albus]MZQ88405.1 thiamine diphosphokinase [Frigidibacter albus]NBE29921.1 thiamine diphosphokinase [Frigidibacter albus]GGH45576.1 thiamine pyrophosphokinase [Frigidibacter albus]
MTEALVQSKTGVTLLGGGDFAHADLDLALALAPLLVAADGGADGALAAGRMPGAVIGDFDSVSAAARAAIPLDRQHKVPEQDSTDFEKCLRLVEAPFLLGLGFAGLRLDHTLSVMTALASHPHQRCLILGPEDVIFLCPPRLTLPLEPGVRLSLFPMGPATGRSSGLRWPIDGLDFAPAGRIGTSNEATGPVDLQIDGPMLVLLPRAWLRPALGALLPAISLAG